MHLKSADIKRLELEFDSGLTPPPFSHIYKLRISFEKSFINTQLDIHYTNREELTENEILDEGFTLEDDYKFIGEIPKIWEDPVKNLYSNTKWTAKNQLDETGGIRIMAKDIHGKIARGIPLRQQEWQYLAQEFIQAVYEIDKKEAPLQVRFKNIQEETENNYDLTVKFSVRKVEANINGLKKELDWDLAKALLSYVYLLDYDYSIAKETPPAKKGYYIDCGDGLWHEFGKGVVNMDDSFDALAKIKEALTKLNQL